MPHDIIDNQSVFPGDAVRPLLDQSERALFAAGYFFRISKLLRFESDAAKLLAFRESEFRSRTTCP